MFCDEALDTLEPIAAGELAPNGRIADHLATCAHCAAALADARELEHLLRQRPVPRASPQFTGRTMARVRRAQWRSEQLLDTGFNFAVGLVMIGVLAAGWMLLNRTGLGSVGDDAIALFGSAFFAFVDRIAPSVPLYAGATLLLGGALGFWWWAEREATW